MRCLAPELVAEYIAILLEFERRAGYVIIRGGRA